MLIINIPYPGASPETVEREVVNRLEKSLQSIAGVTDLYSTSREAWRLSRSASASTRT